MLIISCDIETYDPHLKKMGPGSRLNDGYIIGVGISKDGKTGQFLETRQLRPYWDNPNVTLVFHNAVYDVDWLSTVLGPFRCKIDDTMTRETLLDSYQLSYSLENCCQRHNVGGKNAFDTIDQFWNGKGRAVAHLDQVPREIVGRYCIQDCIATYNLWQAQQPALAAQGLLDINKLESDIYPWLMECRKHGLRIDNKQLVVLSKRFNKEFDELHQQFVNQYGDVNVNSALAMEKLWKTLGIPCYYTETGRPSFTSDVMSKCTHPVAKMIRQMKALEKLLNTYIDGQFQELQYNGRLWPVLYPAKRDAGAGGTVTGRFSSSHVNAQNISAREEKHGTEVRSLFIPEDDCYLGAFDYKQIEYRVLSHFAIALKVSGGADLQKAYQENPDLDYHEMGQKLMGWMGMGKSGRHLIKNFGFGSCYGLGPRSFAERFHDALLAAHPQCSEEDLYPLAKMLQDEYFEKVPFVRPTMNYIMNRGEARGYVKTIGGRHQRMPPDKKSYKLINYLIQGSAADIFKRGQIDAWNAGVYNVLIPHIMVHDEMVFSIPRTEEGLQACLTLQECMCNAFREKLLLPLGVDTEIGPDWGHCDGENWGRFREKKI